MSLRSKKFRVLPLGKIRPAGWMLSQLQGDLSSGFAGCLDSLTERAATDLFTNRIESSSQQSAWWDSETRGNWLWGYVMMSRLAGFPEHQARAEELINQLKQTQDADGYIGIYSPQSRYRHGDNENGELWGQGRALLVLLSHYELTGDESSLRAVRAATDLTLSQYGPGRSYFRQPGNRADLTGMTHGLCFIDVVEWLYEITGDQRYRDFGTWLYQDFNHMQRPFSNDDMTVANLLDIHQYLGGHAVHTVEHLRALLFAWSMSDDCQIEQALNNAFWKLGHYALPSGAVIGDEGLHGLPLPEIGYEYCTLTELLFSLSSAIQKTGQPGLGDWIESLAFNAAQGARFPDGSGVAYLSLDTRISALITRADSYSHLHEKHGRFKYSPAHEDVACCCNPNAVRLLPHYVSRMWMQLCDQSGIVAITYGPCILKTRIQDADVIITEETEYPFSDEIHFTVSASQPVEFALFLRKPAWCSSLSVDGAALSEQDGWLEIEKKWGVDDTFTLTFHPHIQVSPYPNDLYAVRRGALQYVYPIEHQLHSVKDYPAQDFHDYEIIPMDLEQAYQQVILDETQPEYGLHFERSLGKGTDLPWDESPLWLKANTHRLVPMGCTILRRASFPLKRKSEEHT
jgi:uncharacterized protein